MINELIIQHQNLPLRAYSKGTLEPQMDKFSKWINDLLGLTGVDAAKRLLIALPAVEKHFWSLGFVEIERAFTMYVDGELTTQPIPNYFTRILVGQIFKEYKQQKPKKVIKEIEMSQEHKDNWIYHGLICCFDEYIQTGIIIDGRIWVHDYLHDLGLIEIDETEKKVLWKKSKKHIPEYKKLRLAKIFDVLEAKGKHIKDLL